MMDITIRPEEREDHRENENVTREAFWNIHKPGCDEHLLLHNLRNSPAFIGELDLVACAGGQIVGNCVCTRAKIVNKQNEHVVLCLGPLSVLPDFQNKGIGSALMNHTLCVARETGYAGIILYGNPEYYHRFGFRDAATYGITTADGQNFDAFMALELREYGFGGVHGAFLEDPAFAVDKAELEEFERGFALKEKHEKRPTDLGN